MVYKNKHGSPVTVYEIWNGKTMVTVTADRKAAEEYVYGAESKHPELVAEFANNKKMKREYPGHPGLTIKEVKA